MKVELLIIAITAFFIYNTYYDGKYTKLFFKYKKYIQMAFLGFIGISLYLMIKRNPLHSRKLLLHANDMIKYMPIDKSSMDMISPILDFTTTNQQKGATGNFMGNYENQGEKEGDFYEQPYGPGIGGGDARIMSSGCKSNNTTKRSVSETKKKYVAASQNWTCGNCKQILNAYFEIDHKIRLQHGGSNHVDNLVALCPNCHREKTALESM